MREEHEKSIELAKKNEHIIRRKDKEKNEMCFLPDNEKITYDSIILLELFNIEEFNELIKGLDLLYENCSHEKLKYNEFFDNDNLSIGGWHRLPTISNSNFENIPLMSMQSDLGHYIKFITIYLHHISPSMKMLKIRAYFDKKASENLNKIIYKQHSTEIIYHEFPEEIPDQKFLSFTTSSHSGPKKAKTKEIQEIRLFLKNEVVNFFSKYFKGVFFKLVENDLNIVPSIEIYSINFPYEEKKLIEWTKTCRGFLSCFQTFIHENNCYKLNYKESSYLFFWETSNESKFSNYFIFMNSDDSNILDYDISFKSVVFNRFLKIQEQTAVRFSHIISEEIENLQNNQLEDVLENRRIISKEIFYFERFKTEFYLIKPENNGFKLIGNEEIDLGASWMDGISKKIKNIDRIINTFNKHSNVILGLKNVEYAKNMQNRVYWLTLLVIILTVLQVISAFKSEIYSLILAYWNIIHFFIAKFFI